MFHYYGIYRKNNFLKYTNLTKVLTTFLHHTNTDIKSIRAPSHTQHEQKQPRKVDKPCTSQRWQKLPEGTRQT